MTKPKDFWHSDFVIHSDFWFRNSDLSFTHLLPLLLEPFHGHRNRRFQFLRKEGDAQLLNHPTINLQLWIVQVLFAMPLGALKIPLPTRANLRQFFRIAPRLSQSHLNGF